MTAWYTPRPAPADLDDVLACVWAAEPTGPHRLVPDGCVDLLTLSRGDTILCGPETTGWSFELPAGTVAVGVRFLPGQAARMLAIDLSTIREERRPFAVPPADDPLDALLAEVRRRHDTAPEDDGLAATVVARLTAEPWLAVAVLADELGVSTRQLHRRALSAFGYGISTLARILRFQRFTALIEATGDHVTLAALAAEAGYADHAHLARDCRAITGLTPTEFAAEYFSTFPDMSDPFKTGAPIATTLTS